jgi:uncharacterized phiE125 gp8 family phage protein
MGLLVVTPPATEPVGLAEAKDWCRVDTSDGDATIASMIMAARQHLGDADGYSGIVFISQTIEWTLDAFPPTLTPFPRWPVSSVTSVTYPDENNVDQIVASTVYAIDSSSKPARLALQSGQSWPAPYPKPGAVRIRFVAGFGATPEAVPEPLRVAIKALVAHWYEYREPMIEAVPYTIPMHVAALVAPHRLHFGVG